MPLQLPLCLGARICLDGETWYAKPNGAAVFLYKTPDLDGPPDAIARRVLLLRDATYAQ